MKIETFGIGIIGYGTITPFHIRSIQELDNCSLIAVQSGKQEKRDFIEKEYQVTACKTYRELINMEDVQIVIICTPSGFHLEPALASLEAGKHVVVEKPLEINTARCEQMIAASSKSGTSLSCIFQNRFSPDYLKAKKAIASGKLGKLLLGNAYIKWKRDQAYYDSSPWRGTLKGDGGAVLINQGIHTIDLLLDLMGKAKTVSGSIRTLTHTIEGEDVAVADIEFENGALGTIEGSTSLYAAFPEKLEIHGEKGSIILEGGALVHWHTEADGLLELDAKKSASGSSNPTDIDYSLHKSQLEAIVNAIGKGENPPVQAKNAMESVAVIEAIYNSSKSGQKITLP